jgi:penicillin-binding protein 1C
MALFKAKKTNLDAGWMFFKLAISFLTVIPIVLLFIIIIPLDNPPFPVDYSLLILDEKGNILRVFLNNREQYHLPPEGLTAGEGASDILPLKLKRAVLLYEDKNFYHHAGINPGAVFRALGQNLLAGKRISGASTITMQVARLMGNRARTLPSKMLESLQSLKLEILYSKEEILKLYLDHAPYGSNIVGYQAASYSYFGKNPSNLTWAEAASLAILPNSPGLISPQVNRSAFLGKRNRLLWRLHEQGFLDNNSVELAFKEPTPQRRFPFPFEAPHLANYIRAQKGRTNVIRTTLSRDIQHLVEEIAAYHMDSIARLGIHNAAVMAAETGTGKVRAYVGSADFYDKANRGQVDGIQALRSTGSLLKPFLYALAMTDGRLLPQTLIRDIPSQFGSFSPKNADLTYRGLVTAQEALIRSLNVPAVRLLSEYGLEQFYQFLKRAGMKGLFRPVQDYGLPLILGGAEGSLFELAAMYRSLAKGGRFSSFTLIQGEAAAPEINLINPGAAYLTLSVLRNLHRPGTEYYWENYQAGKPIAWKTGTSFGQKDAWSIGVSPQWIVAVWVGNFSGEGNANLKSSTIAAPLLFDIFNSLPANGGELWFDPGKESLQPVNICRLTGFRAGPDCSDTQVVLSPVVSRPLAQCPYHKKIFVTLDGNYRVNSLCWEPGNYKEETRLFYPADVVQYLRERGQIIERIPPLKPDCPGAGNDAVLRIVYPEEGTRIWIPRDLDGSYQKVTLKAAHQESNQLLYWYLDNRYIGQTDKQHNQSLMLNRGWHRIEVVDHRGNRDFKKFYVAGWN